MKRSAVVLAVAILLLSAGIALASIPDANGVIHGCRKNSDGSLRVIDTAVTQNCMNGYTALNWSQTGPQGPAGSPGISGLQYVTQNFGLAAGGTVQVQAMCPEGKGVIGGGFSTQNDWLIVRSAPVIVSPNVPATAWEGIVHDLSGTDNNTGAIYAVCAVVAS